MDKEFSYSVDVSNVGCHCNAAAYFIDMPGKIKHLDENILNFQCQAIIRELVTITVMPISGTASGK